VIEDAEQTAEDAEETGERVAVLRGRSVGLCPLEVDDAEVLYGWRADPVATHEIGIWPRPLSWLRERVERDIADSDRDDFLVLLPDGTPIGHVALTDQDIVDGTADVYLLLGAAHRGRGHASDALDTLVDLAFGDLPLHRLQAITHTTNAAALAVLAASGFVHEGVRRSWCLHRGRRHDVAVFSLLRPEWEALTRPRAWDR
jgi:RimJ/RimL family protein N-acetyltransferase